MGFMVGGDSPRGVQNTKQKGLSVKGCSIPRPHFPKNYFSQFRFLGKKASPVLARTLTEWHYADACTVSDSQISGNLVGRKHKSKRPNRSWNNRGTT